jgi:4-amino-4-deoxy-L-arabinose transferase-like glycosyltransferase
MPVTWPAATSVATMPAGTLVSVSGEKSARQRMLVRSARFVSSIPRSAWTLIAVMALVRLGFTLILGLDEARLIEPDSNDYLLSAEALLDDGRFWSSPGSGEPEFERTPGYPLFIAAIFALSGRSVLAVALVQSVVSVLVAVPMFLLARRLFNERVGIMAIILLLLDPLSMYFGSLVLTETLATLLIVASTALIALLVDRGQASMIRWSMVGLLLAAATYVRPGQYYLPLLVVVLLIWTGRRHDWGLRQTMSAAVALLLPVLLLVGGWQVRNAEQIGSSRFSGIEAVDMMKYRAAGVVAEREGGDWREVRRDLMEQYGPEFEGGSTGEYYDRMYDKGLELVLDDPLSLAKVTSAGAWRTAVSFPVDLDGMLARWGLPDVPLVRFGISALMVPVWALATCGLAHAWRRGGSAPVIAAVLIPVIYLFALSSGPQSYARFRVPIMPILWLFAAGGLVVVAGAVRSWMPQRRRG